ncbi:MAG: Ca-activated chloride channel [Solirubrobacteraceae bacterium]|jgi:Ca-activated chloride channel family protein|nr:Ca-activated chloride channel [Solirubrobacteraceae bacterium]
MSFQEPVYLLALLVVPALAAAFVLVRRRRRRYAVRFPAAVVLAAVRSPLPAWRRWIGPAMLALAAIAAALAVAKPEAVVAVPIERASVMLVTDTSGSMAATDVSPTRLDAVRGAVRSFLGDVPEELLVGFQSYATGTRVSIAPSTRRGEVRAVLDGLQAQGGTATGDTLATALDQLAARRGRDGRLAPAAIVLLSDGATTEGSDPLVAAVRARELGIPIYTVALGTAGGVVTDERSGQAIGVPPDPATLREIAARSGGEAFEVDDADALDEVYERLGSRIGTRKERREVSSAFAGGSLVLLLGGLLGGVRFRARLP